MELCDAICIGLAKQLGRGRGAIGGQVPEQEEKERRSAADRGDHALLQNVENIDADDETFGV